MPQEPLRPETLAIKAGRPEQDGDPLNPPMVAASNYRQGGTRSYSRGDGSATIDALEDAVGQLEGGLAVAFASGMAAVAAILDQLPSGARVVAPEDCYHGVGQALEAGQRRFGWQVDHAGLDDTTRWMELIETNPDLLWLESPSNPLLVVADVPALCEAAAAAGVAVAVDNTFATPLLQRPLAHGATWSIHSATKFIGGHSDLLGGIVTTTDPDRRQALVERQVLGGATIGTLEAYLALRGLRTLPLRLERAQANAGELARRLVEHPAVTSVRYPGLPDDPGHEVATRTLDGAGAVLSFETVGSAEQLDRALDGLDVVVVATSLGGVETTIERRARLQGQAHLPPTLVRVSIGCEHVEDLWNDLNRALAGLGGEGPRYGAIHDG